MLHSVSSLGSIRYTPFKIHSVDVIGLSQTTQAKNWWLVTTYYFVMLDILTAKPIPTEQPATNKAHALFADTPTATTTSSPGTSPKASKPLAIPSAYKKFMGSILMLMIISD